MSTFSRATICFVCLVLSACDFNKVYDDFVAFENAVWRVEDLPEFQFQIEDASITYDLELTVRHSSQYPYQNLFVTYFIETNSGEILNEELHEIGLFESKTGEPLGGGLGDIFDFVSVVESGYTFPREGTYKVKLEQFMRTDELLEVVAVGLRVSPSSD